MSEKLKNKAMLLDKPVVSHPLLGWDTLLSQWCLHTFLRCSKPPVPISHSYICVNDYTRLRVTFNIDDWHDASFSLFYFPFSERVCLSTSLQVPTEYRGRGIATWLMRLKFMLAREHGMHMILATVDATNTAENRVLDKFPEWERLGFVNPDLVLWGATIKPTGEIVFGRRHEHNRIH